MQTRLVTSGRSDPRVVSSPVYHVSTVRVDRMAEFQGQGLINSHGEEWLHKRRFLSKSVRKDRLVRLLTHQQELLEELLDRAAPTVGQGSIDVHEMDASRIEEAIEYLADRAAAVRG